MPELINEVSRAFDAGSHFLVYIRERSWFFNEDKVLKFSYLSFRLNAGVLATFSNLNELQDAIRLAEQDNWINNSSELCTVYYKDDPRTDFKPTVNLLQRIFVSLYLNCGYHEQFRSAVSARFIRDFFKTQPQSSPSSAIRFIRKHVGLTVSLWRPRDSTLPRHGHECKSASEMLTPLIDNMLEGMELFEDLQFINDVETVIKKRNQTCGCHSRTRKHYVIRAFTHGRATQAVDGSLGNWAVQIRAIAIFQSEELTTMSLDAVYHAVSILERYFQAADENVEASLIKAFEIACAATETKIAAAPVNTTSQLLASALNVFESTIERLCVHSSIQTVGFWQLDPFNAKLVLKTLRTTSPSGERDGHSEQELSISDSSLHIAANAAAKRITVALTNRAWIDFQIVNFVSGNSRRNEEDSTLKRLTRESEARSHRECLGGSVNCAGLAVPVMSGGHLIGVLEVASFEIESFGVNVRLVEYVASLIGAAIRRIELANDRAWLARMSFIHAARHRVEKLLVKVAETDRVASDALRRLVSGGSVLNVGAGRDWRKDVSDLLSEHGGVGSVLEESVLRVISELEGRPALQECVLDILDNICSNSKHADLKLDDISLMIRGDSVGVKCVEVSYITDTAMKSLEMQRLGVSPLRRRESSGYRYGMFLLSTQVRMLGGVMWKDLSQIGSMCMFRWIIRIPVS